MKRQHMIATKIIGGGGARDTTAPTCVVTANAATIAAAAFTATFTFSEAVVGFDASKITVTNGTAAAVAGTGPYTSVITPTATGTVTVKVAAGAVTDAAGNNNAESNTFSILYINPVMWVKADAGAGTNDGDVVTTWTDQSGNNNSPTQGGAASLKPSYQTNEINGLPVVRGDGGDSLKIAFTLDQPCSYLFVFKMLTEGDSKTVFDGNAVNTGRFTETVAASDTFRIFAGAGVNIVHPAIDSFAIGTAKFNGASSRVSIGATAATGNSGTANPGGVTLFANGNGLEAGNLDIAEMIVFAGAISDANFNLIGAYLGTKYNLTWTNF